MNLNENEKKNVTRTLVSKYNLGSTESKRSLTSEGLL